MDVILYKILKKRGFIETIMILNRYERKELVQYKFNKLLEEKEEQSYYNAHLRARPELLKLGIMKYRLNTHQEKVLCLTEKGKAIAKEFEQIEKLLNSE